VKVLLSSTLFQMVSMLFLKLYEKK
jgi:hypothetical protein